MSNSTRIFRAAYRITTEGVTLSAHDHRITVTGYGQGITFLLDGQPATLAQVEAIRHLALSLGTFERLSGPALLGTARACQLHRDLGRLHIGGGHALASEVLGRRVTSLATLSIDEARQVWSYGCSLAELPTQPSALFKGMAA